jgi:beta-phosphoglucomutase
MSKKIKAIIFDLDGVLIEAKDWHYEALNRGLDLFGYNISRYDHLVTYDGLPTVTKLEMLSREKDMPSGLHEFINELKQKYTMELVYAHCKPRFYHEYALSRLKNSGYKLGCASNSVRDSIDVMLDKSNLKKYMDITLSAQDVDNPKPFPDIFISAMKKLKVDPDECLILEDNHNGIKAAKDSGANVLIVKEVDEVNIDNIESLIDRLEGR